MSLSKIKKRSLLVLIAGLYIVFQVKAQELSTDEAANTVYSNEKYHFSFSFPLGFTIYSVKDCDYL